MISVPGFSYINVNKQYKRQKESAFNGLNYQHADLGGVFMANFQPRNK
jgi:hypothetical protein